jgi:hypothetical protein
MIGEEDAAAAAPPPPAGLRVKRMALLVTNMVVLLGQ